MKILFLPHCLKEEYAQELRKAGKEKNYQIYTVPGGSLVKKIIDRELVKGKEFTKIVGIACNDEIALAMGYLSTKEIDPKIIYSVPLSKDGCKNTEVNLEDALKIL